jgi:hypothetical protein
MRKIQRSAKKIKNKSILLTLFGFKSLEITYDDYDDTNWTFTPSKEKGHKIYKKLFHTQYSLENIPYTPSELIKAYYKEFFQIIILTWFYGWEMFIKASTTDIILNKKEDKRPINSDFREYFYTLKGPVYDPISYHTTAKEIKERHLHTAESAWNKQFNSK